MNASSVCGHEAELAVRDREMQQLSAVFEENDRRHKAVIDRVDQLLARIARARSLHQPIPGENGTRWCQVCSQEEWQPHPVGWWVPFPCPTLQALEEEVAQATADPEDVDNPSAQKLAAHIDAHPVSVVMAACRLLGWQLTFELSPAGHPEIEEGPACGERPDCDGNCCKRTGEDS